ncbi:MAG: DUF1043 family protein [Ectothiorhodospiraceae bacterium]|nr:DUF1043 family protein [Ectothiorhodospiraceae bacterium]
MSAFAWLLILAVGVVVAFVAGRMTAPGTNRTKALEHERDAATSELRRYREDVSAHFEKTATLFNQVTGSYRSLYEHLADGSQKLGLGGDANLLHAEPERRKLDSQKPADEADKKEYAEDSPADRQPASEEPRQDADQPAPEAAGEQQAPENADAAPEPAQKAHEGEPEQDEDQGRKPPSDFAEDSGETAEQKARRKDTVG